MESSEKPINVLMDDEGYLVDPGDWNESVAEQLAQKEGLVLHEEHWDIIRFMRQFFEEHQVVPDVRFVIRHMASSGLQGNARSRLFEIFPYGYVKQACRIAGMRRPRGWSTG